MSNEELETYVISLRDQVNAHLAEYLPYYQMLRRKGFENLSRQELELVYGAFAAMLGNINSGYWSLEE